MRPFILTAAITILLTSRVSSQNNTYFGLEFSVANDIYKITDNGDYLMAVPLTNTTGGITIRQEINKILFIETGLLLKYYQEGYGFKTSPNYNSSSSENSWIIPLRAGMNLNIYKHKIHFVPVVGYSFGINPPFGYGLSYGRETSSTTVINYYDTENPDVSRYFSLLQAGLGFEFRLFKTMLFSISSNYYIGFSKISQLDITYTVDNSQPFTGTATSKGDFWCISTGLKYPISNFWKIKKVQ